MKRILAIDGGGIRGIFSLQILRRLEWLLRQRAGSPTLVLGDVFDCFAGTSTGAIIATCLCWGMTVDSIEELYLSKSRALFSPAPWYRRFHHKYRPDAIAGIFQDMFRENDAARSMATLGSKRLGKLLILAMRNATTGSPWPLSNHPDARFNDRNAPDCNLNIPLWQLLRASTAAPALFPPQPISIGGQSHLFVDGGVTPFNNPAFLAVSMTLLPCYRIGWQAGTRAMHVISVGTGNARATLRTRRPESVTLLQQLRHAIPALIGSVGRQQDMICRMLGDCLHGDAIDGEIGTLQGVSLLSEHARLFSYVRYDQDLTRVPDAAPLRTGSSIDDLSMMDTLKNLGVTYASEHVRAEHLFPRHHSDDGVASPQIAPRGRA